MVRRPPGRCARHSPACAVRWRSRAAWPLRHEMFGRGLVGADSLITLSGSTRTDACHNGPIRVVAASVAEAASARHRPLGSATAVTLLAFGCAGKWGLRCQPVLAAHAQLPASAMQPFHGCYCRLPCSCGVSVTPMARVTVEDCLARIPNHFDLCQSRPSARTVARGAEAHCPGRPQVTVLTEESPALHHRLGDERSRPAGHPCFEDDLELPELAPDI